MSKFVKVTLTDDREVWINTDKIVCIEPEYMYEYDGEVVIDMYKCSKVRLDDDAWVKVDLEPDELMKLVNGT